MRAALPLAAALALAAPAVAPSPLVLAADAPPGAWLAAARGGSFELLAPWGRVTLQALPAELLAPGASAPAVTLFRLGGDAWGALAVTDRWATGFAVTPRGLVALGQGFPGTEELEEPLLALFEPPGGPDHTDCLELVPSHFAPPRGLLPQLPDWLRLGLNAPWADLALQLVLDADAPFLALGPLDWRERQLAVALQASVVFEMSTGIRFEVVAQHADEAGAYLTSEDPSEIVRQLRSYWATQAGPREAVHLVSGREFTVMLSPLVSAQVLGASYCIGSVADPDRAFSLSSARQPAWRQVLTMAHELGHDFGAHHHYATCLGLHDPVRPCTVMASPANLAGTLGFGPLERIVIRGYAEAHGV